MTTEKKQAAQAKRMLTRAKNTAYKQYLTELRQKELEFPEKKRQLEEWGSKHGMPDLAISAAAFSPNEVRKSKKRAGKLAAENDEFSSSGKEGASSVVGFFSSFPEGSNSIYSASVELDRRMVESRNRTRKVVQNESPEEFVACRNAELKKTHESNYGAE